MSDSEESETVDELDGFNNPCIIDMGSQILKAGFSGHDEPLCVMQTIIGKSDGDDEIYLGDTVSPDLMDVYHPIKNGFIDDWENMGNLWHVLLYEELQVPASKLSEMSIMITEASGNPKKNRQTTMQIMFEVFEIDRFHLCNQAILALFSAGKTTGVVIDSGYETTNINPVYDGVICHEEKSSIDFGGKILTNYMDEILVEKGENIDIDTTRHIKETSTYCALDYAEELKALASHSLTGGAGYQTRTQKSYELPDGTILKLGREAFQVPEAIFNPILVGKGDTGIHIHAYEAIEACEAEFHKELYKNIVLVGGGNMFPNLNKRFSLELLKLTSADVDVLKPPDRYSIWYGGAILTSMSWFEDDWITKEEYENAGDYRANLVARTLQKIE